MLRDTSTHGSAVSYDEQAKDEVRHHFTWIHNLKNDEGEYYKIQVHIGELEFKVKLASYQTCEVEYNENMENFLKNSRTADPPLGALNIDSFTTEVPSHSCTPGQRPVYVEQKILGEDSFGRVYKVIDASTGAIYARKTFHHPRWVKDLERRRRKKEEWLDQIGREIRIMRDHPHVSKIHPSK